MNVGINGFGRIARVVGRAIWGRGRIDLMLVNDPAGAANAAVHVHQLGYSTLEIAILPRPAVAAGSA